MRKGLFMWQSVWLSQVFCSVFVDLGPWAWRQYSWVESYGMGATSESCQRCLRKYVVKKPCLQASLSYGLPMSVSGYVAPCQDHCTSCWLIFNSLIWFNCLAKSLESITMEIPTHYSHHQLSRHRITTSSIAHTSYNCQHTPHIWWTVWILLHECCIKPLIS